jgi:hypothetical protein
VTSIDCKRGLVSRAKVQVASIHRVAERYKILGS